MDKTVRVVSYNASLAGKQCFDVGRQRVNLHASDPDVSRLAIKVLAVLGRLLLLGVVAGSAESTVDVHSLAEVIPDFLQ